jgi:hypothetical protein
MQQIGYLLKSPLKKGDLKLSFVPPFLSYALVASF